IHYFYTLFLHDALPILPAEVTIDFCDADIDFALADAGGNILGYIAATAGCPEVGGFSGLPDGNYFILAEVWDNPFEGEGLTEPRSEEHTSELQSRENLV